MLLSNIKYFNSSVVRLKVTQLYYMLIILKNFNSSVVRLKEINKSITYI